MASSMNQVRPLVRRALRCRYNLLLISEPALGKTTMINKVGEEEKAADPYFCFQRMDGGTMAPTDTVMAMPDMDARSILRLIDGRLPNAYNTPDMRGIIYIGEWMLMGAETSRGFQKLINHEDLGGFRIPDGVIFVADGNGFKHRSQAQQQSRAIMSRFMTVELEFDPEYALDVAKDNFHEKVSAFLMKHPACLSNYATVFDEKREINDLMVQEGKMGIWANLRSWDKVSRILKDVDETHEPLIPDEIARNVGSGVASTFETYLSMVDNLATIEEILKRPDKAKVPERMDECFALTYMLALTIAPKTFKPMLVYMARYKHEFQNAFTRLINERIDKSENAAMGVIQVSKEYKDWMCQPHINRLMRGSGSEV
jgi:hypothetical protein